MKTDSLHKEEHFHDAWADSINIDEVMVDESFEACTSPENRIILRKLGDIKGKKLLDLGCGAGEAAVYFAKKGADVTAVDVSDGMLNMVKRVAERHNVNLQTKQSYSHKIDFNDETFDIVYAANLLHHVDIEKTIKEIHRVLKKDGVFVSWDPLAYNPIINIYRWIAIKVRTEDEHPLRWKDLRLFNKFFPHVNRKYFWLSTLTIFVIMAIIQKRNPNKERYWKVIIDEAERWERFYRPLELLDRIIMRVIPPLRLWCWNVVIIARRTK